MYRKNLMYRMACIWLKEWTHTPSKGMFFLDEDTGNLLCHQYDLKLTEDTSVWITIQPLKSRCLGKC